MRMYGHTHTMPTLSRSSRSTCTKMNSIPCGYVFDGVARACMHSHPYMVMVVSQYMVDVP